MTRSLAGARVLVTGGAGFLGGHVVPLLEAADCGQIVVPRSGQCELREPAAVTRLFAQTRFDLVIHLAARVGGIGANRSHPGTFFRDNLLMGMNVVDAAREKKTRVVMVGTICSYPKMTPVPFRESDVW